MIVRRAVSVKVYHLPAITSTSGQHPPLPTTWSQLMFSAVRSIVASITGSDTICATSVPVHDLSSRHGPAAIALEIFA